MEFQQLLADFGFPLAALIVVVVTGSRGMWVFGRELRSAQQERDEWKRIALAGLNVAEKITNGK